MARARVSTPEAEGARRHGLTQAAGVRTARTSFTLAVPADAPLFFQLHLGRLNVPHALLDLPLCGAGTARSGVLMKARQLRSRCTRDQRRVHTSAGACDATLTDITLQFNVSGREARV